MKNRIIEGTNVYVLITYKNFNNLPAHIQDDILYFTAHLKNLSNQKKSIKKILNEVLKEKKFYVKYKDGEVFRTFTEEEMKNDLLRERTQTRKVLFEKFIPGKLRPRRRLVAKR